MIVAAFVVIVIGVIYSVTRFILLKLLTKRLPLIEQSELIDKRLLNDASPPTNKRLFAETSSPIINE